MFKIKMLQTKEVNRFLEFGHSNFEIVSDLDIQNSDLSIQALHLLKKYNIHYHVGIVCSRKIDPQEDEDRDEREEKQFPPPKSSGNRFRHRSLIPSGKHGQIDPFPAAKTP